MIRWTLFLWVRLEGLEPPTHCLEGSCSVHLSYRRTTQILAPRREHQRPNRALGFTSNAIIARQPSTVKAPDRLALYAA